MRRVACLFSSGASSRALFLCPPCPRRRPRVFLSSVPEAVVAQAKHPHSTEAKVVALLERTLPAHRGNLEKYRINEAFIRARECPVPELCSAPEKYARRLKPDNVFTFGVHRFSGAYHCFRCGAQGTFRELARVVAGGLASERGYQLSSTADVFRASVPPDAASSDDTKETATVKPEDATEYVRRLWRDDGREVLEYLTRVRGLDLETIAMYGCGCDTRRFYEDQRLQSHECITFPWIVLENIDKGSSSVDNALVGKQQQQQPVTVRVKLRSITEKRNQKLEPRGGGWGLFGLHTVPHDATEVILTEGEFDAMAVRQATGRAAISLPNGASSLPSEAMALLERFKTIYLWLDNDASGRQGAKRFAQKLGSGRCRIVDVELLARTREEARMWHGVKDANDALRMKILDLNAPLDAAPSPSHAHVVTFGDLRSDVLSELRNPGAAKGTQCASFPQLMSLLGGFRDGEVTLLTGPTGGGKTTLASQMTLDLCASRVASVLWGSFEVKNSKLAVKMLRQTFQRRVKGKGLSDESYLLENKPMDELESYIDLMERLPLHFMTFHGATKVEDVVDAMEFAYHAKDVSLVVLDNLQFMTDGNAGYSASQSADKFRLQDMAFSMLRKFATDRGVHVLLVVHPRKEDPGVKIHINSIYGGAKATQEADNILILNNPGPPPSSGTSPTYASGGPPTPSEPTAPGPHPTGKELALAKNRDAGILGTIELRFNDISVRYEEVGSSKAATCPDPPGTSPVGSHNSDDTDDDDPDDDDDDAEEEEEEEMAG